MQREITIEELEKENKRNQYLENLSEELEKSEKQYKNGKVHKAEDVFKELRKKYGYKKI